MPHARPLSSPKVGQGPNSNMTDWRVLGLTRCVEIIGEAASSISADFRTAHPGIPWRVIIGMQEPLDTCHYFDVWDLSRWLDRD